MPVYAFAYLNLTCRLYCDSFLEYCRGSVWIRMSNGHAYKHQHAIPTIPFNHYSCQKSPTRRTRGTCVWSLLPKDIKALSCFFFITMCGPAETPFPLLRSGSPSLMARGSTHAMHIVFPEKLHWAASKVSLELAHVHVMFSLYCRNQALHRLAFSSFRTWGW